MNNKTSKIKKIKEKTLCFFGFHEWEYFLDNFHGEIGVLATVQFKHCKRCAKSKIDFIYGSETKGGE